MKRPPYTHRAALLAAALLVALAATTPAIAHWIKPEEIIAGLQNPLLENAVGIAEAHRDPNLPRLLIIAIHSQRWEQVPEADRIKMAADWYQTWRHNVPEGIVAVVDADTHNSLIHYDGYGNATIRYPRRKPTPAPTPAGAAK